MCPQRETDILLVGNDKQHEINVYVGGRNERIVSGVISGPTIRDFYDVEYCTAGSFTLFLNGVPYEIKEGNLFIVPPLTRAERHFTADTSSAIYVGVKGLNLSGYLKTLGFSSENVIFPYRPTPFSIQCLQNLIDSLEVSESLILDKPTDPQIVQFIHNESFSNHTQYKNELRQSGLFSLFLSELMQIQETHLTNLPKESIQHKYLQSATRYIEANHHLKITVDDIANHVGITRSYLFKLFREEYDTSVQDYLIHVRMKSACYFLRQPGALIKNIASSLGYDPFSFSRIFKKTIGISPTEYQKKYTKGSYT